MHLDPNEEKQLLSRNPPLPLAQREACVALHMPNVLRVPNDSVPPDPRRWFNKGLVYGSGKEADVTEDNEVTYLIDGPQTFRAMVDAIETATKEGHFIYLAGWFLGDQFDLALNEGATNQGATNVHTLFQEASRKGVHVRALLWDHPMLRQNEAEGGRISELENGRAVLDGRHLDPSTGNAAILGHLRNLDLKSAFLDRGNNRAGAGGAHHQKLLVVYGLKGLIAFCGGIDINPDRLHAKRAGTPNEAGDTEGAPFHDVHCRIRGKAAYRLLDTFAERWVDHPDNDLFVFEEPRSIWHSSDFRNNTQKTQEHWDTSTRKAREFYQRKLKVYSAEDLGGTAPKPGRQYVQIGRTYGNTTKFRDYMHGDKRPYEFAKQGETTARDIILHAIGQARRFIYLEDQYLVDLQVAEALNRALPDIKHLTILIPADSITPMRPPLPAALDQCRQRRVLFLRRVKQNASDENTAKVRVFILKSPGADHTYVHSKMWVMDDEFAIIGSANVNRRSYTHDSEVVAAIGDQNNDEVIGYHFAHRLRMALWAEHLGMDTPEGRAELADGIASVVHWVASANARIEPYDDKQLPADLGSDLLWTLVDPNGA